MSSVVAPFYSEHGLHSLRIGIEKVRVPITESSCAVAIMYGDNKTPKGEPIRTGRIPMEGELVYKIIEPGGHAAINVVSSLKLKEKTSE